MAGTTAIAGGAHEPHLDGVRGIAIVMVWCVHLWILSSIPQINELMRSGWLGVDLFFVLSGFLITGILLRTRNDPKYFRNFYARRTLRIFPLYYLALVLAVVLLPLLVPPAQVARAYRDLPWHATYLTNVRQAFFGKGIDYRPFGVLWSLAVEEQFYLIWAPLVRFASGRALRWLLIAAIVLAPIARFLARTWLGWNWWAGYVLTPLRVDAFAVGALIALLVHTRSEWLGWLRRAAKWLLIAGVAIIATAVLTRTPAQFRESVWTQTFLYSVAALTSGALILVALDPGRVAHRILGNRFLRHIGTVSYGGYLYHPLLIVAVGGLLTLGGLQLASASLLTSLGYFAAMSLLTILVATLSYRYFERPLLGLKRHFKPTPPPLPELPRSVLSAPALRESRRPAPPLAETKR